MTARGSKDDALLGEDFIQSCYPSLLSFARSQLGDDSRAQDVVQETLMSAMQYQDRFAGHCAFKTWVFAILKNKIIDELRISKKYIAVGDFYNDGDDDLLLTTLFDQTGHWQADNKPGLFDDSWCNTDGGIEQDEFWQVLEMCLTNLPAEQARVFLMKEYMEMTTDEICETCQITRQNFYVLMHRARLRLQYCLKLNWFYED